MFQNSALADLDSKKSSKSSEEKMGDADSEIIVPVQEIEAWMDEALEEVDEGLQNLISLMGNLNERTKEVQLEFKSLGSLKRFFMSLNLFVVPVILAILMCYGARESLDGNLSGFETGFQITLNVLMFLSGAIGLPFYFYSIYESFRSTKNIRKEYKSLSQSSMRRLNEFARMVTNRMPDSMRLGLERRSSYRFLESSNAGSSFESRHFIRRLSESVLQTLDPLMHVRSPKERHEGKQGEVDGLTQSNRERQDDDLPILYELQFRTYDQSKDLSIKIEPAKKDKPSNGSAEIECKKSSYSLQDAPSKFEQSENETFEIPS